MSFKRAIVFRVIGQDGPDEKCTAANYFSTSGCLYFYNLSGLRERYGYNPGASSHNCTEAGWGYNYCGYVNRLEWYCYIPRGSPGRASHFFFGVLTNVSTIYPGGPVLP